MESLREDKTRQFGKRGQPGVHFRHQHVRLTLREEHHVLRQRFRWASQFSTEVEEFILGASERFVEDRLNPLNAGSRPTIFVVGNTIDFSQHHAEPTVGLVACPDHAEPGSDFLRRDPSTSEDSPSSPPPVYTRLILTMDRPQPCDIMPL